MMFKVQLFRGPKPNLAELTNNNQQIENGLGFAPSAASFVTGLDGRDYVYIFPTLFYRDPQLPGIEFIRSQNGSFVMSRLLPDVSMGAARDFSLIDDGMGYLRLVIVDHGSEYANTDYTNWPFGHVWVGIPEANGFKFEKISDVAAFNHAVSLGDLNLDGRLDIVTSHMGVKAGGVSTGLHAYIQQSSGNFVQEKNFAQSIVGSWGSGAVTVANINQSIDSEVIQANYSTLEGANDWGALRVLGRNSSGTYDTVLTIPREGLFTTMGATRVVPFDYDLDGDLDLVISLEGKYSNLQGTFSGNGLEIFENKGFGNFVRSTSKLFDRNSWAFSELQFREFEILDFDGDGFQDIILNGWGGKLTQFGRDWDLSSQLFLNIEGKKFSQLSLSDAQGLHLSDLAYSTSFIRAVKNFSSGPELFIMQNDGTPITAKIEPLYRNLDESLIAKGIGTIIHGYGGNDFFKIQGSKLSINGGEGLDTAIYDGKALNYSIRSMSSESFEIKFQEPTNNFTHPSDILVNVERFQFEDKKIALDLLPTQAAGQAALLVGAVLPGRLAFDSSKLELVGAVISLFDQGFTLEQLAGAVLRLPIWDVLTQKANPTTADIATYLIQNINPNADRATIQSGITQMQSETAQTQGAFLASLAASEQAQVHVDLIGLAQTGLLFT